MTDLLTEDEHTAIRLAGELYTHIVSKVIGHGRTRHADITEIATPVHHIQHAVMAQAAARAYRGQYRLLGELPGELPGEPAPPGGQEQNAKPCTKHPGSTCHVTTQYRYDGPCPNPVEHTTLGELAAKEKHWLCGCGFCPQPAQAGGQEPT